MHLHAHSTMSFLDGYGTPKQIAERVVELGHEWCALTDHGNIFAHVPWQTACRKQRIKPLFGCEFYVVEDLEERTRSSVTAGASSIPHVTVVALNQAGYSNLLKLIRLSNEEGFYYKPRIDWAALIQHQSGLAVLSGCVGGWPSRLIIQDREAEALELLTLLKANVEQFFVEIVPQPDLPQSHVAIPVLWRMARELRQPVVITADAHFPRPEDWEVEDLMVAVGIRKRRDDPERTLRLPRYQYYCSEEELVARASQFPTDTKSDYTQEIEAPQRIANAFASVAWIGANANVEIPHAKPVTWPGVTLDRDAPTILWEQVVAGAQARGVANLPVYQDRAAREFRTLREKGFCDYILVIADMVLHAKRQGGLVVLRGSAGGCLLLWLLSCSTLDPIVHGLSFERFYDPSRPDPPDVDVDFERGRREAAIQYVYSKYGQAHCSQIAALSQVKAKAAVQDVAFALGIPRAEFAPLSAALDSRDEDVESQLDRITDSRALAVLAKYPDLARLVPRVVGQCRQQSVHAAGVLISSDPLTDVIGVVSGHNRQPVATVDKKGAAELGFLKIDFLSVSSLDVVATAVRALGHSMSWLDSIPLDDRKTLEVANRGLLAGVFQLDGGSAARVSAEIGLDDFGDIAAASALCRPGPGDWVPTYRGHKRDAHSLGLYLARFDPRAARIVAPTYGILVYQEQVMALARELAGLDWPLVHQLRKQVADKVGLDPQLGPAWRSEWHTRFVGGCLQRGVRQDEAEFWWQSVQTHGGYSFNKSHCFTYGVVGYWMLYLKAHHPGEFYHAYLSLEEDEVKVKRLIFEFRLLGGNVLLLDPRFSKASFHCPWPGTLVGGWANLKGVGPAIAAKILQAGPFRDWDHAREHLPAALCRRLDEAGVLNGAPNPQALIALAPWYPVPSVAADEAQLKASYSLLSPGDLREPTQGQVFVAGYVTATYFDRDKVRFSLEDNHGLVLCKLPTNKVEAMAEKFKLIRVSDYVAVAGWWSGDALYAKDYTLLRRKDDSRSLHSG